MKGDQKVSDDCWEWDVEGSFNPRYDATVSAVGVKYCCEIQGPFCGYDGHGSQTWNQFLEAGPPADIQMPSWIRSEIQAYGLALKSTQ